MKFILGTKIGMSQIFDDKGNVIPVTVIEAGPCIVTQVKTKDRDGYRAAQIGFGKKKRTTKPMQGHLRKIQTKILEGAPQNIRWLREFRIDNGTENGAYEVGGVIDASVFQEGDVVQVSGLSKGKGFQGVVKRHGFGGAPATHGTKHAHRQPGSIGASFPQKVLKGTRMAGHMGQGRITIRNLKVVKVDKEKNLLALKGAVPGGSGTLLEIRG